MGKSSLGRRGLVIETAPGVHPGFSGCLTLELANVGEIPIVLKPRGRVCGKRCKWLINNPLESPSPD